MPDMHFFLFYIIKIKPVTNGQPSDSFTVQAHPDPSRAVTQIVLKASIAV